MAALQQMMGRPQGGPPGGEVGDNPLPEGALPPDHANPHAGAGGGAAEPGAQR
jgi:hypothetical protein